MAGGYSAERALRSALAEMSDIEVRTLFEDMTESDPDIRERAAAWMEREKREHYYRYRLRSSIALTLDSWLGMLLKAPEKKPGRDPFLDSLGLYDDEEEEEETEGDAPCYEDLFDEMTGTADEEIGFMLDGDDAGAAFGSVLMVLRMTADVRKRHGMMQRLSDELEEEWAPRTLKGIFMKAGKDVRKKMLSWAFGTLSPIGRNIAADGFLGLLEPKDFCSEMEKHFLKEYMMEDPEESDDGYPSWNYSLALWAVRKLDDIREMERLIDKYPDTWQTYKGMADLLTRRGEDAKAEEYYKAAVEAPDWNESYGSELRTVKD